jgi:alpha-methylacyl-CoA racemase
MFHELAAVGLWSGERGANLLDSGAPFYDVYETADGGYMAVGALEPRFYAELLRGLGLDEAALPAQHDRARWPELRERLAASFKRRTRAQWSEVFEGGDACVAPVLSLAEAPAHPHNRERGTFVQVGEVLQPAPAPRFSRTPCEPPAPAAAAGEGGGAALSGWGFTEEDVAALRAAGALG